MRTSRFLAAIAFAAVLAASTGARAESTSVTALRESARTIESRENAIHARAEHTSPAVRKSVERVVSDVARHRRALTTRLDLIEMVGQTGGVGERALVEMTATVDASNRLLDLVEKWLGMR